MPRRSPDDEDDARTSWLRPKPRHNQDDEANAASPYGVPPFAFPAIGPFDVQAYIASLFRAPLFGHSENRADRADPEAAAPRRFEAAGLHGNALLPLPAAPPKNQTPDDGIERSRPQSWKRPGHAMSGTDSPTSSDVPLPSRIESEIAKQTHESEAPAAGNSLPKDRIDDLEHRRERDSNATTPILPEDRRKPEPRITSYTNGPKE